MVEGMLGFQNAKDVFVDELSNFRREVTENVDLQLTSLPT